MWEVLSASNLSSIARLFREAIDLDQGNAAAFAGLSLALIVGGLWGLVRTPAAFSAAKAAMLRALEIDPQLPEAKCASAWVKMVSTRDWQGARRGFDEALQYGPRTTHAMVGRALLYFAKGSGEEAASLLLEAAQRHPLSSAATAWYCWGEYLSGEYTNALLQIEQYRAGGRSGPVVDAAEALVSIQLEEQDAQIGRIEALSASSPHHEVLRGALGYAYATAGQSQ